MTQIIVTTTINPPTPAIEAFDAMDDWHLIVVGDLKTPPDYKLQRGQYLSPEAQEQFAPALSQALGWNTHARRNIGHLMAKTLGATVVAMVDDDNIPLPHWGKNLLVGQTVELTVYDAGLPAFDPIGATNYPHLWHRGFPLQWVSQRQYSQAETKPWRVDIQADFWNGDPDIDATARMIYGPHCQFDDTCFPMASNQVAPFNSQNTFVSAEVLPYCFVLPFLTPHGRLGDIWMAYHVQAQGFQVAFNRASVIQQRNPHDLTVDFMDEVLGVERTIALIEQINQGQYHPSQFWPQATLDAYGCYQAGFSREFSHV